MGHRPSCEGREPSKIVPSPAKVEVKAVQKPSSVGREPFRNVSATPNDEVRLERVPISVGSEPVSLLPPPRSKCSRNLVKPRNTTSGRDPTNSFDDRSKTLSRSAKRPSSVGTDDESEFSERSNPMILL